MPLFRSSSFTFAVFVCCCPVLLAFLYQPCSVRPVTTKENPRLYLSTSSTHMILQRRPYQRISFFSSATDRQQRRLSIFMTPIQAFLKWFRSALLTTLVAFFFLARGPAISHAAASGGSFSGSSFQQQTTTSSSSRSQRSESSHRYVGSSSSSSSTSFYFERPSSSSSPRYSTTARGMLRSDLSSVTRTAPISVLAQLITIISIPMFLVPRLKSTAMAQVISSSAFYKLIYPSLILTVVLLACCFP